MTISVETGKSATYTGDSSTTSFSFSPIVIQDADQLEVWRNTAGTYVLITRGTGVNNYSVSVSAFPGTGTITYPADTVNGTALSSSQTLVIKRKADLLQEMDLENQGGYFPENQEDAFDLARIVDIQQQEEINRCLKIPIDDDTDPDDLWFPGIDDRAEKFMYFDADGLPSAVSALDTGIVAVSSFAETLLDDTSAQAFINTLTPIGQLTITDTDDGSGADPTLFLERNSASPADDDDIGRVSFTGKDDGGNTTTYASIQARIKDASDATEDGELALRPMVAGTQQDVLRVGTRTSGETQITVRSEDAGAGAAPSIIGYRNSASPADNDKGMEIVWMGRNDNSQDVEYATIEVVHEDVSDNTEDGYLYFNYMRGGSVVTSLAPGILYSPVATTSGTSQSQTGIPAGARRITVMLMGVGVNGTAGIGCQLGDSGGLENSGYTGGFTSIDDTVSNSAFNTTSVIVCSPSVAADTYSGEITFTLADPSTNTWVWRGMIASDANTDIFFHMVGRKSLSAMLDRVGLTSSDTFDAGSFSVLVQ